MEDTVKELEKAIDKLVEFSVAMKNSKQREELAAMIKDLKKINNINRG